MCLIVMAMAMQCRERARKLSRERSKFVHEHCICMNVYIKDTYSLKASCFELFRSSLSFTLNLPYSLCSLYTAVSGLLCMYSCFYKMGYVHVVLMLLLQPSS